MLSVKKTIQKGKTAIRIVKKFFEEDASPENSMIRFARKKTSAVNPAVIEKINSMNFEGMTLQKVALNNILPTDDVEPWIRQEMATKQFPEAAIASVCLGVKGLGFEKRDSDFQLNTDGVASNLYQYALWVRESPDKPDHKEVAFICSNAKFQTAPAIVDYEETTEPVMEEYIRYEETRERGLFGTYTTLTPVTAQRQIATQTVMRPIFRESGVMSADDIDALKVYFEHKSCADALDQVGRA